MLYDPHLTDIAFDPNDQWVASPFPIFAEEMITELSVLTLREIQVIRDGFLFFSLCFFFVLVFFFFFVWFFLVHS